MFINNLIKTILFVSISSLLIQGCVENDASSGDPVPAGNDIPKESAVSPLSIDSFSSPETVAKSNEAYVKIEVSGVKNDALIMYRFLPDKDGIHFKPNSGVIAKNNLIGALKSRYISPESPGLYHYIVEFYDVDNEVTQQEFTIEVTN